MKEIIKKLTSRKFLLALTGMIGGLALAFGVESSEIVEIVSLIGGVLAAVSSAITYIKAEAMVDATAAGVQALQPEEERPVVVEGFK